MRAFERRRIPDRREAHHWNALFAQIARGTRLRAELLRGLQHCRRNCTEQVRCGREELQCRDEGAPEAVCWVLVLLACG